MAMSCEKSPCSSNGLLSGEWLSGGYRVAIGWENVRYSGSPEESDRIEFLTM